MRSLFEKNEFINQRRTKSVQYIGLRFLGIIYRAVPFQYSALTNIFVAPSENVFVVPSETVTPMLIRQTFQLRFSYR